MTRFTGPHHQLSCIIITPLKSVELQLDLLHELHGLNITVWCAVKLQKKKSIIYLSEIYLFSMKTVNPGFWFWSSLQGLDFCDPLPALSLSMHQRSCRPFTKPGLKYSTWSHHEILLVRASLGPLTHIMWWNSTTSWSSFDFTIPSASQEASAS